MLIAKNLMPSAFVIERKAGFDCESSLFDPITELMPWRCEGELQLRELKAGEKAALAQTSSGKLPFSHLP